MGRRARYALIVMVAAALARGLAAQNPTLPSPQPGARDTTARDTTARDTSGVARLIFNDVFATGTALAPRVVLTEGVVYRFEVDPGDATVSIRSARRPSQPPLLMVPLSREALSSTASAFLVVPRSTEEYRIDIAGTGDMVRLRIWIDPKESARFTRIRTEGFKLPILAISLSATVLAPFRDAHPSPQDTLYGYNTSAQPAYGAKVCLDVLPNGRVLPERTGGCAIAFTLWRRAGGRNFFTVGIEPELVIVRRAWQDLSLTPQLAFGNTTGGVPHADYVFYGLGARYTAELAADPRLGFQGQANLLELDSSTSDLNSGRVHTLTLSLEAGVIFKL